MKQCLTPDDAHYANMAPLRLNRRVLVPAEVIKEQEPENDEEKVEGVLT